MRLVDRQVRGSMADHPRGLRQVEHLQEQGEERSRDGCDVEDEKTRHQEIGIGVQQRLSGPIAAVVKDPKSSTSTVEKVDSM